MTMTCLSIAKALWLRATGQSEWCRCIVCRDKFLNKPDPLNFSEDARKFQKRLRRWPKTYKRRKSREHKNENDKDDLHGIANKLTYEEPIPKTQNKDNDEVRSHPAPSSSSIPETPRRRDVDVSEPGPLVTKVSSQGFTHMILFERATFRWKSQFVLRSRCTKRIVERGKSLTLTVTRKYRYRSASSRTGFG
ncbi:hypothetical protein COOONC_26821 [Cooperia oncophora]